MSATALRDRRNNLAILDVRHLRGAVAGEATRARMRSRCGSCRGQPRARPPMRDVVASQEYSSSGFWTADSDAVPFLARLAQRQTARVLAETPAPVPLRSVSLQRRRTPEGSRRTGASKRAAPEATAPGSASTQTSSRASRRASRRGAPARQRAGWRAASPHLSCRCSICVQKKLSRRLRPAMRTTDSSDASANVLKPNCELVAKKSCASEI